MNLLVRVMPSRNRWRKLKTYIFLHRIPSRNSSGRWRRQRLCSMQSRVEIRLLTNRRKGY